MPTKPKRVCARCHQPAPASGVCKCRPAFEGSTHPGGTDTEWAKARNLKRQHRTVCQYPGCMAPMTVVDHILPQAEGGTHDWHNLQSLCKPHHDEKTTADALRGKTRPR